MIAPIRLPKFWVLACTQVALVLAAAVVWYYLRTEAYLAGPPDGDIYAWNWGYQIVMFAIFWLPAILLCTGVVLVIERWVLAAHYRAQALSGDEHGS